MAAAQLQIQALTFALARAELTAILPAPERTLRDGRSFKAGGVGLDLLWNLEIEAIEGMVRLADGEEVAWQPQMGYMPRFAISRWQDIAGQEFHWDQPFNEEREIYNGYLYIFANGELPSATLRFGARTGNQFELTWTGTCDIFWEEYAGDLPFSVTTPVTFTGIKVYGYENDSDATLHTRLARRIEVDDLHQQPIQVVGQYDGGVAVTNARFTPVIP